MNHQAAQPADHPSTPDALFQGVYAELRALAQAYLNSERPAHTLQPTALVHEAYLRMVGQQSPVHSKSHFLALAAMAMRRILVNHARDRKRLKRGGDRARVPLTALTLATQADETDLLALDEALARLEARDPRKVRVVELRYFAGLSVEQTAQAVDASPATVKRDWDFARAWLLRELHDDTRREPPHPDA